MKTTIRALLCIALLATYSSCIPIGSVRKKEDFGLPGKLFFPKEGGERIYFAKKEYGQELPILLLEHIMMIKVFIV